MRMTADEYRAIQRKLNDRSRKIMDSVVGVRMAIPQASQPKALAPSKYRALPTVVDNIRFDSKAEAKRYQQLRLMERAGEIVDLRIQVEYELIPPQKVGSVKERPVKYVADFVYRDRNGGCVVEDVKSGPTKTREFVIKRKLLLQRYRLAIREVLMD